MSEADAVVEKVDNATAATVADESPKGEEAESKVSSEQVGDSTAEPSAGVKPSQSSTASREQKDTKQSQNGKKGKGKSGRRVRFPSILAELGLKATSKGVVLPESRRNFLKRRREARDLGMIPAWTPNLSLDDEAPPNKKQRKRNQLALTGRMLDELESDLFSSAFCGDVGLCQETIAAGVDVNVKTNADHDGIGTCSTALHIAAAKGNLEIVAALVKANADVLAETGRGEIPVKLATRAGHVDVVRILGAVGGAPVDTESAMQLLDKAPQWGNKHKKMHSVLLPQTWGKSSSSANGERGARDNRRPARSGAYCAQDMDNTHDEDEGVAEPHSRSDASWRYENDRDSAGSHRSPTNGRGKSGGKRSKGKHRGRAKSED